VLVEIVVTILKYCLRPKLDQALLDHPQTCTRGVGVQVSRKQVLSHGDRFLVGVQVTLVVVCEP